MYHFNMDLLIIFFVTASYFMGIKAILGNKYRPSIYSRVIWFLLAINNFVSVLFLKNSYSVILLAGLSLVGCSAILLLSLRKSKKLFGLTELISTFLLLVSFVFWIFTRLPLLTLILGLIITLIGGIPTLKQVIKNPNDEDILFWFFFAIASAITLASTNIYQLTNYLYPLFYLLFNTTVTILCLRRYID